MKKQSASNAYRFIYTYKENFVKISNLPFSRLSICSLEKDVRLRWSFRLSRSRTWESSSPEELCSEFPSEVVSCWWDKSDPASVKEFEQKCYTLIPSEKKTEMLDKNHNPDVRVYKFTSPRCRKPKKRAQDNDQFIKSSIRGRRESSVLLCHTVHAPVQYVCHPPTPRLFSASAHRTLASEAAAFLSLFHIFLTVRQLLAFSLLLPSRFWLNLAHRKKKEKHRTKVKRSWKTRRLISYRDIQKGSERTSVRYTFENPSFN